jgi:hypothetical protein
MTPPFIKERNFRKNDLSLSNDESWQYVIKNLYTTELVADLNNDVIVVGRDMYDNIILLKLNSSGFLLFEKNLTLQLNYGYYYFKAISVGYNNCIYVSGIYYSLYNNRNLFLIKFDVLGNMLWTRTWGGKEHEYVNAMSVDTNDSIYLSGYTNSFSEDFKAWNIFLVKYNNTGDFQWAQVWVSNTTNSICNALATDSNNNIYMAGQTGSTRGSLAKYNYSGSLQWNITLNNYIELRDVAVDLHGNIYSISESSYYSQLYILKYNDDGISLWNKSYTINDIATSSIALDSSGNIYIGGSISLYSGQDTYDMFIMKCNNSGSFQWYIQFGTYSYENFRGVACDSLGNVYLLSESRNDDIIIVIFKNPTNGLKLFQHSINGYFVILLYSATIISITIIMFLIVKFKKCEVV